MNRQRKVVITVTYNELGTIVDTKAEELDSSAQPERPEQPEQPESAKEYCAECDHIEMCRWYPYEGCEFRSLPSAQPEPLTDKEQRIFLAAMGREEKVCKQVDQDCSLELYEDSLVRTCHQIVRKVKGALWT